MGDGQPGDDLVAAFGRWAADQRVTEAASARARQRWLTDQATSTATWAGTFVDLAEAAAPVGIALSGESNPQYSGSLIGIGRDFCVVSQSSQVPVLISLASVVAVWPTESPRRAPASGDRNPSLDLTLADAVRMLAEDRVPVLIRSGGRKFAGSLLAVGEDVVTVLVADRQTVYLALGSIAVCEIR